MRLLTTCSPIEWFFPLNILSYFFFPLYGIGNKPISTMLNENRQSMLLLLLKVNVRCEGVFMEKTTSRLNVKTQKYFDLYASNIHPVFLWWCARVCDAYSISNGTSHLANKIVQEKKYHLCSTKIRWNLSLDLIYVLDSTVASEYFS